MKPLVACQPRGDDRNLVDGVEGGGVPRVVVVTHLRHVRHF